MSANVPRHAGGRPKTETVRIQVRMPVEDLGDLDGWIERQPGPKVSRAEALRLASRLLVRQAMLQAIPEERRRSG